MTLGNMRANGVRSLDVCCWLCHHRAVLSADSWPDHVPVPSFGPRMVCTRCGIVGDDARPNWLEQPPRESRHGLATLCLKGIIACLFALFGTPCKDAGSNDEFYFVDSSRAGGKYKLFGSALVQVKNLTVDEKKVVTTWIISQHRFGIEVPQIVGHNIDEIRRGRRMSFSERVDRALLFLGERSEAVGTCIALNLVSSESRQALDEFLAFTESRDAGEAQLFLRMLGDSMDLVGCVQETLFFLKPNGWLRLDELQSKVVRSSQAFLAMWFNDKLTSAWDLGFRPAIVRAGYSALRIDQKEHANKICDEIIAEIRRSRFVVADYTGHRGGVYYEAGFAAGRDLPVILTCRKSDMATLHFDIRQFNCIDWESTEELAQRLQVRIEALLGGGPLKGTD